MPPIEAPSFQKNDVVLALRQLPYGTKGYFRARIEKISEGVASIAWLRPPSAVLNSVLASGGKNAADIREFLISTLEDETVQLEHNVADLRPVRVPDREDVVVENK